MITGSEMSFLHSLRELVEKAHLAAAKGSLLTVKGELREEGQWWWWWGAVLGEGGQENNGKVGKVGVLLIAAQSSLLVINPVIKVNSVRHAWK